MGIYDKSLGERIVMAARMATADQLQRIVEELIAQRNSRMAAGKARMQQTRIGGADWNGITDDPPAPSPWQGEGKGEG